MIKTYTLVDREEQQISDFEGKMIFHLEDENGDKRTVWGLTALDDELNAFDITALRNREHPLIQCLFLTNVGEQINIEFTQYNDVFERNDAEIKVVTAEDLEKIAQDMQDRPMRVGALLKSTQDSTTEIIT